MSHQSIAASVAEVILTTDSRTLVDAMHKSGTSVGRFKPGQIKRFQASARDADVDDLTVILARVSSNDIASFIQKIKAISGVTKVNIASRHSGEPERSPD